MQTTINHELVKAVKLLLPDNDTGLYIEDVKDKLEDQGFTMQDIDNTLNKLEERGEIYYIKNGLVNQIPFIRIST